MTPEQIQKCVEAIRKRGPDRVMINSVEAVSAKRAAARGVHPDVIFLRHDGWSLGASWDLQGSAHQTWKSDWVAVLVKTTWDSVPYDDWAEANL